ncbi:MAG TPA: histidine phosphatase family protein [Sphingobium sp.]|uniref:histidine phosphatase family protein n=1 Tax=Sphingobium sp. TaxID=1912891 RepID=UPI002ED092C9
MILLCAAATRSSRTGAFGCPDEALDDGGRRAAGAYRVEERFRDHATASPARAAIETATAMGINLCEEPALQDMDHGDWAGCAFEDVHRSSPEAFATWMANPSRGAPGGETLSAVQARIGRWLDGLTQTDDPLLAITHPMVIRGALAHALNMPLTSTLAIDIAPLARVRLSFNRIWRLQAIEPAK